jgi:hypothetical protein
VLAAFDGIGYRGSIVRMGGKSFLGVTKESEDRGMSDGPKESSAAPACNGSAGPLVTGLSRFARSTRVSLTG